MSQAWARCPGAKAKVLFARFPCHKHGLGVPDGGESTIFPLPVSRAWAGCPWSVAKVFTYCVPLAVSQAWARCPGTVATPSLSKIWVCVWGLSRCPDDQKSGSCTVITITGCRMDDQKLDLRSVTAVTILLPLATCSQHNLSNRIFGVPYASQVSIYWKSITNVLNVLRGKKIH